MLPHYKISEGWETLTEYDKMFEKLESDIVLVPGCFDFLHLGHLSLLQFAASFGNVFVALNSDESIKRSKGKSRPIFSENIREKTLWHLDYVYQIVINYEDTPEEILKELKPKYVVKGSDWKDKNIIEEKYSKVIYYDINPEWSTTKIIERIKAL